MMFDGRLRHRSRNELLIEMPDNIMRQSKIIHSKENYFDFEHDKDSKSDTVALFFDGLISLFRTIFSEQ